MNGCLYVPIVCGSLGQFLMDAPVSFEVVREQKVSQYNTEEFFVVLGSDSNWHI